MWSSSDLQGGYSAQWVLNPSTYQNVSNEEVDWASLAQQWIKMKETFPAEQVPPAPPPPPLSGGMMATIPISTSAGNVGAAIKGGNTSVSDNLPSDVEGGEAPMDMDTKEDNDSNLPITTTTTNNNNNNSNSDSPNWGTWNNWQQWGWSGNWPASGAGPPGHTPGPTSTVPGGKPAANYPYTPAPSSGGHTYNADGPGTFDYNHSGTVDQFNQQGYWMGGQSPFIRQKGSEWRQDGRQVSGRSGKGPDEKSDEEEEAVPVIDAAKRKQLPAWIREGLEKMEKEKLKKEEKERMQKEREVELARRKEMELQQEQSNKDGIPVVPHSKFDTDSEDDSDVEVNKESDSHSMVMSARKSRFDQSSLSSSTPMPPQSQIHQQKVPQMQVPSQPIYRSKEEIMQEVMRKVRLVLTDILMSVTSEEIEKAATETLISMRAKAPATQHRKTPALTSLTGKLGLGIYNSDDDSDASDASDDEGSNKRSNGIDSDDELKERLQRRKQEFARVEGDIISKIEEEEERERRQLLDDEDDGDVDDNDEVDADEDQDRDDDDVDNDATDQAFSHHDHRGSYGDEHQVEAKHTSTGSRGVEKRHNSVEPSSIKYGDEPPSISLSDRRSKNDENSSRDQSDETEDDDSVNSSDSSSHSNSSNSSHRRKRSSKKRKKKNRDSLERSSGSKRSRKRSHSRTRSRSRGSDRKRSLYRKSSHDSYSRRDEKRRKDYSDGNYREEIRNRDRGSYHEKSHTRDRDRSRSRDRDRRHRSDAYRYRRRSPSPHKRKHHSSSQSLNKRRHSSSSPESIRSKRSSGRDREYEYRENRY